ncbi:lamin tail domain-containing protein [Phormidium sp. LEGE 05292]|nr:lamin tail domain-containing protein [Phormidium sp. LEGE 05292]
MAVNKNDSLFFGVKTLYQDRGIHIINLQPDSSLNQIILTNSNGQELMATAEFIKSPVPQTAPETTPASEAPVDLTPTLEPEIAPEAPVDVTPAPETTPASEAPVDVTPAPETTPASEAPVDLTPTLEPEIAPEAPVDVTPAPETTPASEAPVDVTPSVEPEIAPEAPVDVTPAPEATPTLEVLVDLTLALEPEIAPEASVEITSAPERAPEPTPEPLVSDSEEVTITATTDVTISKLLYKGEVKRTQSDEYIEISNLGNSPANISGWKITSGGGLKQFFIFPEGTILESGKSFRVYTNEVHPETGGFSYGSKTAVWNDAGDEAKLFDADGNNVSTLAYGKNTVAGITQELKVPQLKFVASYTVINKQMALGGEVTFTEALSLAIKSFLEDDTNPNSPLALILKDPVAFGLKARATKAMAVEELRSFMNENGTLSLLPTAKHSTGENGETVEKNWIFELSLGAFGETTFFAVVPR